MRAATMGTRTHTPQKESSMESRTGVRAVAGDDDWNVVSASAPSNAPGVSEGSGENDPDPLKSGEGWARPRTAVALEHVASAVNVASADVAVTRRTVAPAPKRWSASACALYRPDAKVPMKSL